MMCSSCACTSAALHIRRICKIFHSSISLTESSTTCCIFGVNPVCGAMGSQGFGQVWDIACCNILHPRSAGVAKQQRKYVVVQVYRTQVWLNSNASGWPWQWARKGLSRRWCGQGGQGRAGQAGVGRTRAGIASQDTPLWPSSHSIFFIKQIVIFLREESNA